MVLGLHAGVCMYGWVGANMYGFIADVCMYTFMYGIVCVLMRRLAGR